MDQADSSEGRGAHNREKTHCPQGHPYSADNVYYVEGERGTLVRRCRACHRQRQRARKQRLRDQEKLATTTLPE